MILTIEFLFILLLGAVLAMVVKKDGFFVKNRTRRAKVGGCWSGKDRRQYPRFSQTLEVAYSVVKKHAAMNLYGKTVDISEGGVRLVLDEKLPVGTFMNMKISIPSSDRPANITGEVVWTEDASDIKDPSGKRIFYSGVKFSSAKESSDTRISEYIRSAALALES